MVDIGKVFCHICFRDLNNGDDDIYVYKKMWLVCGECREILEDSDGS